MRALDCSFAADANEPATTKSPATDERYKGYRRSYLFLMRHWHPELLLVAMILRKSFFMLYGVASGVLYTPILYRAIPDAPVAAVVFSLVLAIALAYCGWSCTGQPDWPNWRLLILLPLMPFTFLIALIFMGFLLLIIAMMWPFVALQAICLERKYRNTLRSKGRFMTLDDLQPRLDAGMGTLIWDWGPKGTYRIWWTEDDLHLLGEPVSTKEDFEAAFREQHPFNTECQKEYLDEETGKAFLTSIPARYARSGRLGQMFPRMKTAIVYRRFGAIRQETKPNDN